MKYRGFSTENNEWVRGYYARIQGKYLIIKPSGEHCEVDPDSVGMKTTKKDRFYVDIYEGDIIELENINGQLVTVEVKFGSVDRLMSTSHRCDIEGFYYETSLGFKSFPIISNYKGITDYELFKVTGNVYTSPDFRNLTSY